MTYLLLIVYAIVMAALLINPSVTRLIAISQLSCITAIMVLVYQLNARRRKLQPLFHWRVSPIAAACSLGVPLACYALFANWQWQANFYTSALFYQQFIYFIVFIALPEEVFFRYLFFKTSNNKTHAWLLSAALFGMMHVQQGFEAIIYFSCLGLFWGGLRLAGLPLYCLVLSHGIYNLIVSEVIVNTQPITNQPTFIYLGSLLLLFSCAINSLLFWQKNKKPQ